MTATKTAGALATPPAGNEGLTGSYSSPEALASLYDAAAEWLVEAGHDAPRPVMPELKRRFGLSTGEAIKAIKMANEMRGLSC
ncbi:hypothetical protein RB623_09975 [Mesorhizobium sp. LHD-90]|uniref:hypothetical protein n=1 Tax=Mesorhizobium sp. LHD-90 TaxID=3071414 RepID=UPI0027DFB356|nr:hypothetical protein [Mesorhizobium sp. LHD-90]MDQ6434375.1 hypothetical protein [Mesorhizobium sp. LHD-90]